MSLGAVARAPQGLLPCAPHGVDLGEDILEIGPGPAVTTPTLPVSTRPSISAMSALEMSLQPRVATELGGAVARRPTADAENKVA